MLRARGDHHVTARVNGTNDSNAVVVYGLTVPLEIGMTLRQFNRAAERVYWIDLLTITAGNVTDAHERSGLQTRTSVYKHLDEHRLSPRQFRGRKRGYRDRRAYNADRGTA